MSKFPEPPVVIDALPPARSQFQPSASILLVDDDADLRRLYADELIRSGYRVDAVAVNEASYKVLHAMSYGPDSYDLLITDNDVWQLLEVEAGKKLRSARRIPPVIFTSDPAAANASPVQLAAILPKPFFPDELLQIVDEVLHWSTVIVNRNSACHKPVVKPERVTQSEFFLKNRNN